MAIIIENQTFIDVKEAAALTRRSVGHIYNTWKNNGWEPYSFGWNLYFKKTDVEAWLKSRVIRGRKINQLDVRVKAL